MGAEGERRAARFLRRGGHVILARNYRTSAGEIDLICACRETLVFVEVKTRTGEDVQPADESVRRIQWQRIERAARRFLAHPAAHGRPFRFDLVTVVWPPDHEPRIEHIEHAHVPAR